MGDLANRRIAVTGAAGGVGSAAVAIAKAQGAEVVGIVSRAQHADYVRSLGAIEIMTAQDVANGALGSETIDGLLDTVAGAGFAAYVNALRPGGALSLVGAVGGSDVSFDAFRLVEVILTGYSTENLDGRSLRQAVDAMADWLRNGAIVAPSRTPFALREAAAAHGALEEHRIQGRVLLVPDR
jgi:NADPH:quinone reductase